MHTQPSHTPCGNRLVYSRHETTVVNVSHLQQAGQIESDRMPVSIIQLRRMTAIWSSEGIPIIAVRQRQLWAAHRVELAGRQPVHRVAGCFA